ncbi:MAG: methyl-accepting chemotaxis protein [Aestuariibacter sp.]
MDILNSISKKVMVGYVGIVVVLLVIATLLYQESSAINDQKQVFVDQTLPTLRAAEQVSSALNKVQIAAFGLYGTTLTLNDFNTQLRNQEAIVTEKLKELERANLGNSSGITQAKQKAWQQVDNLKNIMAADGVDWDGAREALASIQKEMTALNELIATVNAAASTQAQDSSDAISDEIGSMRTLIIVSVLLISGITVGSFLMAQQNITKPVKSLSSQLDRIAVENDLSNDVQIRCSDEIGIAASSVNKLLVAFRNGNTKIQRSAAALVESVSQLNHSAEVSEEQVNTFTTHIQELLEKISDLEDSIEDSANRSAGASDIALTGAEQARTGASNVSLTSNSIEALAKDVEKSAEMLLSLKNAGDQVSSVVKTIAEIAEQTNLLALNAAIEAARAGESGRGFAVVADEVRTLASRTHDSTHEINKILETIVDSISSTVTSMESNKVKATEAVELAQTTVTSLDDIKDTVIQLSRENKELANLGQDIKSNASAMRISVDQIQDASEHVTESSKETRSASNDLTLVSNELSGIAGQFKV